jgi:hypothetical protein
VHRTWKDRIPELYVCVSGPAWPTMFTTGANHSGILTVLSLLLGSLYHIILRYFACFHLRRGLEKHTTYVRRGFPLITNVCSASDVIKKNCPVTNARDSGNGRCAVSGWAVALRTFPQPPLTPVFSTRTRLCLMNIS